MRITKPNWELQEKKKMGKGQSQYQYFQISTKSKNSKKTKKIVLARRRVPGTKTFNPFVNAYKLQHEATQAKP